MICSCVRNWEARAKPPGNFPPPSVVPPQPELTTPEQPVWIGVSGYEAESNHGPGAELVKSVKPRIQGSCAAGDLGATCHHSKAPAFAPGVISSHHPTFPFFGWVGRPHASSTWYSWDVRLKREVQPTTVVQDLTQVRSSRESRAPVKGQTNDKE